MTNQNREARGSKKAGVSVGGRFAPSERSAPSGAGLTSDSFADIRKPEWEEDASPFTEADPYFGYGQSLGLDSIGVTMVETVGDPASGEARLVASVYENPVDAGCLTRAQWEKGDLYVINVLKDEYGAEVWNADDGVMNIEFSVELGNESTMSDRKASDLIWEKTQAARLAKESDRGTFGSPFIYDRIAEGIDNGYFPAGHDTLQSTKETASFALHGRDPELHGYQHLAMLARRGYTIDAEAAAEELVRASKDVGWIKDTRNLLDVLLRTATINDEQKGLR